MARIENRLRYSAAYRRLVRHRWRAQHAVWTVTDERMRTFYGHFASFGDLVFDVGANWGTRTKVFVGMGLRVVAVEPQPALAAALRTDYKPLGEVRVVEAAVTEAPGPIELLVSDADALTSTNREWIDAVRGSGRHAARSWDRSITVEGITLDGLIERFGLPQLIKIDIEGGELAALRGLSASPNAVTFEYTPERPDDAERCLEQLDDLGPYRYNLSPGDGESFVSTEWLDAAAMSALLRERSRDGANAVWGDVCAVLPGATRI